MSLAEDMEALASGAPSSPLDQTLGIRLVAADDRHSAFELDVGHAHHNPVGAVQGGVVGALADAAMGHLACRLFGGACTNVDLHLRFLNPVEKGRLTADATIVRRGRRVSVLSAEVRHGERLIATATSAFVPL